MLTEKQRLKESEEFAKQVLECQIAADPNLFVQDGTIMQHVLMSPEEITYHQKKIQQLRDNTKWTENSSGYLSTSVPYKIHNYILSNMEAAGIVEDETVSSEEFSQLYHDIVKEQFPIFVVFD